MWLEAGDTRLVAGGTRFVAGGWRLVAGGTRLVVRGDVGGWLEAATSRPEAEGLKRLEAGG